MTLEDLRRNFDTVMFDNFNPKYHGFTVGGGRKEYWYIIGSRKIDHYRVLTADTKKMLAETRTQRH